MMEGGTSILVRIQTVGCDHLTAIGWYRTFICPQIGDSIVLRNVGGWSEFCGWKVVGRAFAAIPNTITLTLESEDVGVDAAKVFARSLAEAGVEC